MAADAQRGRAGAQRDVDGMSHAAKWRAFRDRKRAEDEASCRPRRAEVTTEQKLREILQGLLLSRLAVGRATTPGESCRFGERCVHGMRCWGRHTQGEWRCFEQREAYRAEVATCSEGYRQGRSGCRHKKEARSGCTGGAGSGGDDDGGGRCWDTGGKREGWQQGTCRGPWMVDDSGVIHHTNPFAGLQQEDAEDEEEDAVGDEGFWELGQAGAAKQDEGRVMGDKWADFDDVIAGQREWLERHGGSGSDGTDSGADGGSSGANIKSSTSSVLPPSPAGLSRAAGTRRRRRKGRQPTSRSYHPLTQSSKGKDCNVIF